MEPRRSKQSTVRFSFSRGNLKSWTHCGIIGSRAQERQERKETLPTPARARLRIWGRTGWTMEHRQSTGIPVLVCRHRRVDGLACPAAAAPSLRQGCVPLILLWRTLLVQLLLPLLPLL